MEQATVRVPTIQELVADPELAYKNDQLKLLLNQPPVEAWLKEHPYSKGKYLPIDKVEFMMDRLFQEWRIEILKSEIMFHSLAVTVRVHYKNPVTKEWTFHDGIGAQAVQTDAGKSATELQFIKSAAVQMALPIAKSYAIKDACDHIGNIFGRNVNRKDVQNWTSTYKEPEKPEVEEKEPSALTEDEEARLIKLITNSKSRLGLEKHFASCKTNKTRTAYDNKFAEFDN